MNELEIIHYRQIEGLRIFFDTVDYRTPHVHPEWELIWILNESLSVMCGQSRFTVQQGQMVLFSPNEPHEFHKEGNSCTFLCMQLSEAILPTMPQIALERRLVHELLTQEEFRALKTRIAAVAAAYLERHDNYNLFCVGSSCLILHELLSKLPYHELSAEEAAGITRRNDRLKRLIQFVDENYMNKIRLADFAASEGCSVSYLSRFIKDTMNQNFQEYVTSVRFNCACKLIAAGGSRMLDVCMESGFSDYRYFSREFRRQYDMTPEEYSRFARKRQLESPAVRHSLHSVERFYSREESIKLMKRYLP